MAEKIKSWWQQQEVGGGSSGKKEHARRSLPYMIFVVKYCEMQLEPVPTVGVRDRRRQGNKPLAKEGAQQSAGCDSRIKLCVLSSIPKPQ
eukprot:3900538-Ditylum_brightwellii.AAC.1